MMRASVEKRTWFLTRLMAALAMFMSVLGLLAVAGCERSRHSITAPSEIGFAIQTPDKETAEALWGPLLADMSRQTGLKVQPVFTATTDAQLDALKSGRAQVGWFTSLSGLEVLTGEQDQVFAEVEGQPPLQSLMIVAAQDKLTSADILRCDKRLTFALGEDKSPASNDAALYYFFRPAKADPQACFKKTTELAAHTAIHQVISGKLNAAVMDSNALLDLQKEAPEKFAKIKVIWASPVLPQDVLIFEQGLDQVTREKLRSFFLSYGRAEGSDGNRQRGILKALRFTGFAPAANSHFAIVRHMRATANLMRAEHSGKQSAIDAAQIELEAANEDMQVLQARTVPQLPADASQP